MTNEIETCDICGDTDKSVRTVEFGKNRHGPGEMVNECSGCRFKRQRGQYRDGEEA